MPTIVTGNIWSIYQETDLFLVPTHAEIIDSRLLLTHPVAAEAGLRFSGIEKAFAQHILRSTPFRQHGYGILISPRWPAARLGAFQVQRTPGDQAVVALIRRSVHALHRWCCNHPSARVDLPYPGAGIGHLTQAHLEFVVSVLPDSVHLWLPSDSANAEGRAA